MSSAAYSPGGVAQDILARCERAGFALAGIAPARRSEWGEALRAWLDAGHAGDMGFLREDLWVRLEPARILAGTRAFIMVADVYAARGDQHPPRPGHGRIARYAMGRDYHRVMKKRLHAIADELRVAYPGSEFRTFVDTAPVIERELGLLAGLGWFAKNTMLIHPRLGSCTLLGGVATTLELEAPATQKLHEDHCGTCTRCIDACPTGAITPYRVDGTACISYLTIERRGEVDPKFFTPMGDWIYGCDVCQDVCPHNSARAGATIVPAHDSYRARSRSFDLLAVLGWDRDAREEAIRTTAMKRASLGMMKRNAIIALGNHLAGRPDEAGLRALRLAAGDENEPELVRRTALRVLERLGAGP